MFIRRLSKRYVVLLGAIVFSVLASTFGLYTYQLLYAPNVLLQSEARSFTVYKHSTASTVVKRLHEGGYLGDMTSFAFLSKLSAYAEHIQPGYYTLLPSMSNLDLLRMLKRGYQTPIRVRFHGLRRMEDIAWRVQDQLALGAEDLLLHLCSDSVAASYGFTQETFGLMFIPNTYEMYWTISPSSFVDRMYQEYVQFWDSTRLARAEALGLGAQEVAILASIVQAETQLAEEKPAHCWGLSQSFAAAHSFISGSYVDLCLAGL